MLIFLKKDIWYTYAKYGLPLWLSGKESSCKAGPRETQAQSLGQEDPLEEEMAAHSSMLAGKFHGRWNLVGCSPRGHEELDPTDVT